MLNAILWQFAFDKIIGGVRNAENISTEQT